MQFFNSPKLFLAYSAVPYLAYLVVLKLAYYANIININMLW
jgi:hypothetical protein